MRIKEVKLSDERYAGVRLEELEEPKREDHTGWGVVE
jgi:hypothetical protein